MSGCYLDCGCYLPERGPRLWCPSCESSSARPVPRANRAEHPVTSAELERAGRVWNAAPLAIRDAFVLHAYGYRCESVIAWTWQAIGAQNQRALARSMAAFTAALAVQ